MERREVVNRHHGGQREARRKSEDRRPEQVEIAPAQASREVNLLPEDAEGRRLDLELDAE
jgi:hypothetical protein